MNEKARLCIFLAFGLSSCENTSAYKVSLISSNSFAIIKLCLSVKTLFAFISFEGKVNLPLC